MHGMGEKKKKEIRTSENLSSPLKAESELSLLDSGELSLSIFTSPVAPVVSCDGDTSSFIFFALLAGRSTGTAEHLTSL